MTFYYEDCVDDSIEKLEKYYINNCKENNVKGECGRECCSDECHCKPTYIPQKIIYDVAIDLIKRQQLALCYKFGDGPFTFYDNCGDEDDVFIFLSDSRLDLERKFGHNFTKDLYLGSEEKGWYHALTVVTRCHD